MINSYFYLVLPVPMTYLSRGRWTIPSFLSLLIGSMFFTGTALAQSTAFSQEPFTDVPANSTDFQAIEYLRTQNVVKGYLDGTFRPDTRINRAEFVEFVTNPFILDINEMGDCVATNVSEASNTAFFFDVSKEAWYAENICFAKTKNIVDGYPDGRFRPAGAINFVEAAKIISNVFSLTLEEYQEGEFWYRVYVKSLSDHRAIPTSIRSFDQAITRGEMAQIVYRLKVDSTQKASMKFDEANNILVQIGPMGPAVAAPKPVTDPRVVNRPSRRSIIADAEVQNALRKSPR